MYIIKEAYNELMNHLADLENDRSESITALNKYRAEGDLSENNDYIQEKQYLDNIESEIAQIKSLLKNVDILNTELTYDFSIIDLGCKFDMTVSIKGNYFNLQPPNLQIEEFYKNTKDRLNLIKYDELTNTTSISGVFCFGGPTDICSNVNILSSESPLGKMLIGKSLSGGSLELEDEDKGLLVSVKGVNK